MAREAGENGKQRKQEGGQALLLTSPQGQGPKAAGPSSGWLSAMDTASVTRSHAPTLVLPGEGQRGEEAATWLMAVRGMD